MNGSRSALPLRFHPCSSSERVVDEGILDVPLYTRIDVHGAVDKKVAIALAEPFGDLPVGVLQQDIVDPIAVVIADGGDVPVRSQLAAGGGIGGEATVRLPK